MEQAELLEFLRKFVLLISVHVGYDIRDNLKYSGNEYDDFWFSGNFFVSVSGDKLRTGRFEYFRDPGNLVFRKFQQSGTDERIRRKCSISGSVRFDQPSSDEPCDCTGCAHGGTGNLGRRSDIYCAGKCRTRRFNDIGNKHGDDRKYNDIRHNICRSDYECSRLDWTEPVHHCIHDSSGAGKRWTRKVDFRNLFGICGILQLL